MIDLARMLPLLSLLTFFLIGCQAIVKPIGGNFSLDIQGAKKELSPKAKKLIDFSFKGLDPQCTVDFHVHAVGLGANNSGAWVNPQMTSLFSPKHYSKYQIYMSASGIQRLEKADIEYIDRLKNLLQSEPRLGRVLLFAFDFFHNELGEPVKAKSTFYIPNDYVIRMAKENPEHFIPVASIHPYKEKALEELKRVHQEGVRFIKWLPNSQHIDAHDPRSIEFFKEMRKLDMTLITHTGHEKAVEGEEYQKLGNPLKFKKALDQGNRIIMAHFASLGDCVDLDSPNREQRSCFDLFWRLMNESQYKNNLYGETSALTLYTRIGKPVDKLLSSPELASRVVHGSDYPLPAINVLYRTSQYHELGYITEEEKEALKEIYHYNPLLFNFVTKRILKHPKTSARMPDKIFHGKDLVACKEDQKQ